MSGGKSSHSVPEDMVLEHLCGLDKDTLVQRFGETTFNARSLAQQIRAAKEGSLAANYREHETARNAAHYVLANAGSRVKPRNHIFEGQAPRPAVVIYDAMFYEGIERIESEFDLGEQLVSKLKDVNNGGNEYRFLNRLFRPWNYHRLMNPFFLLALEEHYVEEGAFDLNGVYDTTRRVLEMKLQNGGLTWTSDKQNVLDKALLGLGSRKEMVVRRSYGIGQERQSSREIAKTYDVTPGCIERIREQGVRDLQIHPQIGRIYGVCTNADISTPAPSFAHMPLEAADSIEYLRLGTTPYHLLKGANLNTIADVAQKSPNELQRIRQMGPKHVANIERTLRAEGFELMPNPQLE